MYPHDVERQYRLRVLISNMPGGPGKPGNNMALENVRRRLQLLHDMELRFSAEMIDDRFVVRIEVPMRIQEDSA